jgi:hypothetical protein
VKHHFTISEQNAMEVYLGICEDLALPSVMEKMNSQGIKSGDWKSEKNYPSLKHRLLTRTIVFYQGWGRIFVVLQKLEVNLDGLLSPSTPKDEEPEWGNWTPVAAWLEEDAHKKEEWVRTAEYIFGPNPDLGGKQLFHSPHKMYMGHVPSGLIIYMRRVKDPSWRPLAQSPGIH